MLNVRKVLQIIHIRSKNKNEFYSIENYTVLT